MLTAPHPAGPCAKRRDSRMELSRWNVENFTVVASALVAKVRYTRPSNPGVRYGRAGSTRMHKPRAVGEIAYHSWLLPMSSGCDSRAAYKPQAPLAELGWHQTLNLGTAVRNHHGA